MREREKKETAREREGEKNEKLKRKPLISTRGVRLFTLGCCQKKRKTMMMIMMLMLLLLLVSTSGKDAL